MKKVFNGVCTALVTPMRKGQIDFRAMGRLIERQIEAGVGSILLLGTTGESATVSEQERSVIVSFAVDVIAGRVPLIIGIGGNNLDTIIRYGQSAKRGGADAVLVTAPYYNKTTQDGLVKYFEAIARALKMPIIAYNVPGRVGMNIEPETVARIAQIKWIHGIKESSGNITQIQEVIRRCPRFPVYCGDDALALASYTMGAMGVVSVASNTHPTDVVEIWRKKKRDKFLQMLPLFDVLFCTVNPIPIKYLLWKKGLIANELRLPLVPLPEKYHSLLDEFV